MLYAGHVEAHTDRAFLVKAHRSCPDLDRFHDRCRELPDRRWSRAHTGWVVPFHERNVSALRELFSKEELEWSDDARLVRDYQLATRELATRKSNARWRYLFNDELPPLKYQPRTECYRHQVAALQGMKDSEFFALLMEQGTGKSKVVIDELAWTVRERREEHAHAMAATVEPWISPEARQGDLFATGDRQRYFWEVARKKVKRPRPLRVLIVCPKSVVANWLREELPKHMPTDVTYWADRLYLGARGIARLVEGARAKVDVKVVVTNYERLESQKEALLAWQWDFMYLDESQKVKHPSKRRSKAAREVGEVAKARRILTGTPVGNSLVDLWSQFEFLSPGVLGYDTYHAFKSVFAGFKRLDTDPLVANHPAIKALRERFTDHSFVVRKRDCLDLPEKVYQKVLLPMGADQRAAYQAMVDEFVVSLGDDGQCEARAYIAQLMRLSQITSGFVRNTDTGEIFRLPDGDVKVQQLLEDLDALPSHQKMIVWTRFIEDVRSIGEALRKAKVPYVTLTGQDNELAREQAKNAFNCSPHVRVLIAHPECAGTGLTLLGYPYNEPRYMKADAELPHWCSTVVYFSNSFSFLQREQSEDRCHRIGLRWPVTIRDYVCESTVDEFVLERLRAKKDLSEGIKNVESLKASLLGETVL